MTTTDAKTFDNMPEEFATQDTLVAIGVATKALVESLAAKELLTRPELQAQLANGRTFVGSKRPSALGAYDKFAGWLLG